MQTTATWNGREYIAHVDHFGVAVIDCEPQSTGHTHADDHDLHRFDDDGGAI